MALIFLLGLIIAPLVEIAVFIGVGREIGALPVILLTVVTAAVGLMIARAQGIGTLARARAEMAAGRPPVAEMMSGALLALSGLLLLIPGFLTDALGALLLFPPLRRLLAERLALMLTGRASPRDITIEADYHYVDPTPETIAPGQTDDDRRA